MISLEKTRQDLKSLNLATIILNFIFAGFSAIGLVFVLIAIAMMNNPEFQASIAAEVDPAQLQLLQGVFGTLGIIILAISTIFPLVVAILALKNRKKIEANQPSLVPYYIGGVVAAFNLITTLFNDGKSLLGLAIQAGLLAMYYFAIKKSKDLLNNSKTDSIIDN